MAVVDLTAVSLRSCTPMPHNKSAIQHPAYGSSFTIDRPGARWRFEFATPPMRVEPDWRKLSALFDDAERLGALCAIPQPGFDPGAPGATVVGAATASGRVVPVTGGTPRYAFRAGQWVSIVVSGQRYADRVAEQAILDAAGAGSIRLRNLLRVPLAGGETIEAASPKAEGLIEVTNYPSYETSHMAAVEWTLTEAR